jgi:hypothetical protein
MSGTNGVMPIFCADFIGMAHYATGWVVFSVVFRGTISNLSWSLTPILESTFVLMFLLFLLGLLKRY